MVPRAEGGTIYHNARRGAAKMAVGKLQPGAENALLGCTQGIDAEFINITASRR